MSWFYVVRKDSKLFIKRGCGGERCCPVVGRSVLTYEVVGS